MGKDEAERFKAQISNISLNLENSFDFSTITADDAEAAYNNILGENTPSQSHLQQELIAGSCSQSMIDDEEGNTNTTGCSEQ